MSCDPPQEAPPPVDRKAAEAAMDEVVAQAPPPREAPTPPTGGELVEISITWEGIGALYKSFFSDSKALTALSAALSPWVNGPAQLFIRYDSENFIGSIRLNLPPGGLRAPVTTADGRIDLQALAPVTTALASYRDAISSNYDIRVQSFSVGLDFYRGSKHCLVGVSGTPPPDGRTVSPCLKVNGADVCGTPVPDGVAFPDKAHRDIEHCLR